MVVLMRMMSESQYRESQMQPQQAPQQPAQRVGGYPVVNTPQIPPAAQKAIERGEFIDSFTTIKDTRTTEEVLSRKPKCCHDKPKTDK